MTKLTNELRALYRSRWDSCIPSKPTLVASAWGTIFSLRKVYDDLSTLTGGKVPWHVLGVLHMMERACSLKHHLHNGDPLTARTVHVPAGRPLDGKPPFSWLQSAEDAVRVQGLHLWADWSLSGTLYQIESWNGTGYLRWHSDVPSPYLWAGSNIYTSGKYTADGKWDQAAVSKQIGAAVLLKHGQDLGDVVFSGTDA